MLNNLLLGIKEIKYQNLQIFFSLEEAPPHVQAVVCEQDTALLLEVPRIIEYPVESTAQLIQQALHTPLQQPGSVLVRTGPLLQFLAIIHNLDTEPTWQVEWIRQALLEILREAELRQVKAMAMPLLGTVHGTLAEADFFVLLKTVIAQASLTHLRQLWLIVSEDTGREEFEELFKILDNTLKIN